MDLPKEEKKAGGKRYAKKAKYSRPKPKEQKTRSSK